MTDIDIPTLKAAALAATPGQWARNVAGIEHDNYIAGTGPWYRLHKGGADMAQADAAYIALANPATVLALIERLERAELAENNAEFWKQRCEDVPCVVEEHVGMKARMEKLEAVAKAARQFADDPDYESDDFADDIRAVLAALEAP